jgi:hypothetical protein
MATSPVIRTDSRVVLVDAVVTDKKGNYVHDLSQKDFKVYEDNKEQAVSSFSFGNNASGPVNAQKHYMILFFDNSSMAPPDQIQARAAAGKFIADAAGPDRLMAVVDFGGSLIVRQNFTTNADLLTAAVSGVKHAENDRFRWPFLHQQRRRGLRRAHDAAVDSQFGEKSSRRSRAQDVDFVFGRVSAGLRADVGTHGHDRRLQQGERFHLFPRRARPGGAGTARSNKLDATTPSWAFGRSIFAWRKLTSPTIGNREFLSRKLG